MTCGRCKYHGKPRYEGWSPNLTTELGSNVTIYAKVACPECGRRLTEEAGSKFVALFKDVAVSGRNRKILRSFIANLILVPAVLAFLLFFGMQMGWWGWGLGTVWILMASVVSIPLLVYVKNNQVAGLALQCGCGDPHPVYMGLLEDSFCYRCFSCGRLLKLRE